MVNFESMLITNVREQFKQTIDLKIGLLKKANTIEEVKHIQGFIAGLEYLETVIQRFKDEINNQ